MKNSEGKIVGMLTSTMLTTKLVKKKVTMNDPISKVSVKQFRNVSGTTKLHELGRVLGRHNFVFVDEKFICSHFDLLNFMKGKQ